MTYLVYDGTFEGYLSAIFDLYDLRLKEFRIRKKTDQLSDLFADTIETTFVEEKYKRVKNKLIEHLGKNGFLQLWKVTLSEEENIEDILTGVIQYTFLKKKNVLKDYGNLYVIQLNDILKKIGRERHRMTAFVRFKLAEDNIYYATIEPDFDVLPLISEHFKKRFADQKWLIFDTRRNYGIYYDLKSVSPIEILVDKETLANSPATLEIKWHEVEENFQKLWINYFKSTNIKSRKNTKLHLQQLPKRYWKYLIEKQ